MKERSESKVVKYFNTSLALRKVRNLMGKKLSVKIDFLQEKEVGAWIRSMPMFSRVIVFPSVELHG